MIAATYFLNGFLILVGYPLLSVALAPFIVLSLGRLLVSLNSGRPTPKMREAAFYFALCAAILLSVAFSTQVSAPENITNVLRIAVFFLVSVVSYLVSAQRASLRDVIQQCNLVAIVGVAVSWAQYYLFATGSDYFTQNEHYTVIFFGYADEVFLRLPGLFESGKSNSTFLCYVILLNYLLITRIKEFRVSRWRLAAVVLCALPVVVLCFTRRPLVALVISIFVVELWSARKRAAAPVLAAVWLLVISLAVMSFSQELATYFQTDSLLARLEFWASAADYIEMQGLLATVFGAGVLQESSAGAIITDNMIFSWIYFGGVVFALFGCATLVLLVRFAAILQRSGSAGERDIGIALLGTLVYLVVNAAFGNVWTNFGESFVFYVAIPALVAVGVVFRAKERCS